MKTQATLKSFLILSAMFFTGCRTEFDFAGMFTKPVPFKLVVENGALATKNTAVTLQFQDLKMTASQMAVFEGADCSGTQTWEGFSSSKALTLSSGDGLKNVSAYIKNENEQSTCQTAKIELDQTAPVFTVTSSTSFWNALNTVSFSGACETGVSIVITGASAATIDCPSGAWTYSPSEIIDATRSYTLSQTDAAGNMSSASVSWQRQTVPNASQSSIAVGPTSLLADGTSVATITLTIKNAHGDAIPNYAASNLAVATTGTMNTLIQAIGVTNSLGQVTATLSSTKAETKTISLTAPVGLTSITTKTATFVPDPATFIWKPVKIGAGGFLRGMNIAPDGTKVVRADVFGAYIWDTDKWRELITTSSMPVADYRNFAGWTDSPLDVVIAPNNTSRLYMMYDENLYRSNDKGLTWARTGLASTNYYETVWSYSGWGQRLAVDPANADVVYAGTPRNGFWVTTNGGTSWTKIASVPNAPNWGGGGYPGYSGVVVDASSGQTAGRTNTIYVSVPGTGFYRSTNAGSTWASIAGPVSALNAKVAADGALYVLGDHTQSNLWRYSSGTWTQIRTDSPMAFALDPFNPQRVLINGGGYTLQSVDRGANWASTWQWNGFSLNATDIPWLSTSSNGWMTIGDMAFDPVTPSLLHTVEGMGYWQSNLPLSHAPGITMAYVEKSKGIEELVANQVLSPPGGVPLAMVWDKTVFRLTNPDVYPSAHGPDTTTPILHGYYASYAKNDPTFIVAIMHSKVTGNDERSGYSTNGGVTWTEFTTKPPYIVNGSLSGTLEASTTTNYVWTPGITDDPYYTLNGGVTWTKANIPGAPTSAPKGWGTSFGNRMLASDFVTPNKFYLYNSIKGLYTTTDGGVTWTLTYTGELSPDCNNTRLHAVPANAGHLFFSAGLCDGPGSPHPINRDLLHSTDGGVTWTAIPNVKEARYIGFGKAAPFATYPTMYMIGWVNNVYGIYRSTDEGQNWTKFGDYPNGSLDAIQSIDGDMNIYGRVYTAFSGSGFSYFGE